MHTSVVIPARDRADTLRMVLAGLARQRDLTDVEVVVVDDGSVDDTVSVARESTWPCLVRVVAETGRGRAAARNAGAAAAEGELLIFLDADILVSPHFVAAHRAAHFDGGPLPLAPDRSWGSVVHGPLKELPAARRLLRDAPDDPFAEVAKGRYGRCVVNALESAVLAMAQAEVPPVAPWLACVGANVSIRRDRWAAAGGFDETFGMLWGCEDLEFGFRLRQAGAGFAVAMAAAGIHLTHPRPGRWEEHEHNLNWFRRRHNDPAVRALALLLSSDGSAAAYFDRVVGQDGTAT